MKALSELNRRQNSTSVVAAPFTAEDLEYQSLPLARSGRRGLHAVAALEMPTQYEAIPVDGTEFVRSARNSQALISSLATNLVIRPAFNGKSKLKRTTTAMLTTEEFIQVRLATVRESTRHCYWPADVVAKFAAAEVIR